MDVPRLRTPDTLSWRRVCLRLQCTQTWQQRDPPLLVFNAIVKDIGRAAGFTGKLCFHLPGLRHHQVKVRRGRCYDLEVLFFGAREESVELWWQAAQRHECRHFRLLWAQAPHVRRLADLPALEAGPRELCLDFLTPLPLPNPAEGRGRGWLDAAGLLDLIERRLALLFGIRPDWDAPATFRVVPAYWHYAEYRHASRSNPGSVQYYNGQAGPLYLKGALDGLVPWLRLTAEVHLAPRLSQRMLGCFVLRHPAPPFFAPRFPATEELEQTVHRVCEAGQGHALALAAEQGVPFDTALYARTLAEDIRSGRFHASPAVGSLEAKPGGGTRLVERLAGRDQVVHRQLYVTLHPWLDRLLHPAAIGYRPGHSWQEAGGRIRGLAARGCRFAARCDIRDFFASIDLERLWDLLDGVLPARDLALRGLLREVLHTPTLLNGQVLPRRRGLIQGSPLSPLLANLYLTAFDTAVDGEGAHLIRYADDCLILGADAAVVRAALERGRAALAGLGLALNAAKTEVLPLAQGVRFLGQTFDPGGRADEPPIAAPARRTLLVTTPRTWLSANGAAVELRRDGRLQATLPLRGLGGIVLVGRSALSTTLVERCRRQGIPLTVADIGRCLPVTFTSGGKRQHMAAHLHARRYFELTDPERLAIAQRLAAGKIGNYATLLRRRYTAGMAQTLAALEADVAAIHQAGDTAAVRGYEGLAARRVFRCLRGFVRVPGFQPERRQRRGADPFNALLDLGYHLLHARLLALVCNEGLNPYLGFLHDGDDDYPALVADLQEPFRALVDRMVLRSINLRLVRPGHFRLVAGQQRLDGAGLNLFLREFERAMHTPVGRFTLEEAIVAQVRAVRLAMLEGRPLWFFRWE